MQNILRTAVVVALATLNIVSTAMAGGADGAPGVTKARFGSLRREDMVVVDVSGASGGVDTNAVRDIVAEYAAAHPGVDTNAVNDLIGEYDRTAIAPRELTADDVEDVARDVVGQMAPLRDEVVTRSAVESGFTGWAVSFDDPPEGTEAHVPRDAVVGQVMASGLPTLHWSLFLPDDMDRTNALVPPVYAPDGVTNLQWAASAVPWGAAVSASRVRVPTVRELDGKASVSELQRVEGRVDGVAGSVSVLSGRVSDAEASKADRVKAEYEMIPPLMDDSDAWEVGVPGKADTDMATLVLAERDASTGIVSWRGVCSNNTSWVVDSGDVPAVVSYEVVEMDYGSSREVVDVKVTSDAGYGCSWPAAFAGIGTVNVDVSSGGLSAGYADGADPAKSEIVLSYEPGGGAPATNVVVMQRGHRRRVESGVVYGADLERRLASLAPAGEYESAELASSRWETVSAYIPWLEDYATNNYRAARLANRRVRDVEAWVYTNSVTREDMEAGMTAWAVTPFWPLGRVVPGKVDGAAGLWSLFRPDSPGRSAADALVPDFVRAEDDATGIVWRAVSWQTAAKWTNDLDSAGIAWTPAGDGTNVTAVFDVRATRVRVPSMADLAAMDEAASSRWETVAAYIPWLEDYATNNYRAARLANRRARDLEAWQYTNALTRADIERGMTDWAVTPFWPLGKVVVGQVTGGDDAGKWSLFREDAPQFTAEYALAAPVAGSPDASGYVTSLAWPGVQIGVSAVWTNELAAAGIAWTEQPGGTNVVAVFDAAASRVRVPTADVTLTPAEYSDAPAFTEWEYSGLDGRFTVLSGPRYYPQYGGWYCDEVADAASGRSYEAYALGDANATNLVMDFYYDEGDTNFTFTAARTRTDVTGYAFGSQTNKVLASTLAVDRLWDRSTNSFLKAEWETDGQIHRIDQNPYASIDWWWRWPDATNWFHAARFYPESIEYWDWDYLKLFAGENAGLWLGADDDGNNNITGGGYIGYRKGFVTLAGPGYYDEIYFPTGVGSGLGNNVFALTKDIDRATNVLYGAVSADLARGLSGKASKSDATLREKWTPAFALTEEQKEVFSSTPGASDYDFLLTVGKNNAGTWTLYVGSYNAASLVTDVSGNLVLSGGDARLNLQPGDLVATPVGYQLGSQGDKPLASEAEAAANRAAISTLSDTKVDKSDVDPLLFAQYYPEGNVKSAAEFTQGIKYDAPDTANRTITVKPFCNTGTTANDNSSLVGRVVIPPFVDAQGNPYIADDGTRFEVVGVGSSSAFYDNTRLVAVIVPRTVATIGGYAFSECTALTSVSLPAVQTVGDQAFAGCSSLTAISLPAATNIGDYVFTDCASLTSVSLPAATTVGNAFWGCGALTSVSLPAATNIGDSAFSSCAVLTSVVLPAATNIGNAFDSCTALTSVVLPAATSFGNSTFFGCTSLASVDFGDMPRPSVPDCVPIAFDGVPTSCKLIVPDAQYDEWTAKRGWSALVRAGYTFLRHSEWKYARKYEVDGKLDKSGGTVTGQLTVDGSISVSNATGDGTVTAFSYALSSGIELFRDARAKLVLQKENVFTLVIPQVNGTLALAAPKPTAGNLAALDADGNPTDSGIASSDVARKTLAGQSMPETPTQNELAEAVKKIFVALGGTVTNTAQTVEAGQGLK